MENPIAVANYFIQKSLDTKISVTPMKLVKLVYIAHGWHLGITDEPLLDEEAEAWKYGPVLASVYHKFKEFDGRPIDKLAAPSFFSLTKSPILPNPLMYTYLDGIWADYGSLSGGDLSNLTHKDDTPWSEVWERRGGKNQKGAPIPNDLIKQHYKMLAESNVKAGIQETLPLLYEDIQAVCMQIHKQWPEKEPYFDGIERVTVMRCSRRLLAAVQAYNPSEVFAKLTFDQSVYLRAEFGDGSTLQVEVLFGLDEGDESDTIMSLYIGSEEVASMQCNFEEIGSRLEQIMLEEYA